MKRFITLITLFTLMTGIFAMGGKEVQTEEIHLVWWHSNSGKALDATTELVKRFNEGIGKEMHIQVEALYQGKANDVLAKFKAVSRDKGSPDLPDIIQLDATGVMDAVSSQAIIYTDDLAAAYGDNLDFLLPHTKESMRYKDHIVGMPFNASSIVYYYNKSAFDAAGVKPPQDLDSLTAIAPRIAAYDKDGKRIRSAFANVPTTYELCAWIGQMDGLRYLTDNKNGHDGIPNKTVFQEEGTLASFLEKWKKLYATGEVENLTSGVTSAFIAGKTASIVASISNLTAIIDAVGDRFEVGVAAFPRVNDKATGGVNIGGGALFAIDKGEARNKAIWTFLKAATDKESQYQWHVSTGYFPVNKDTYTMSEYLIHCEKNPRFKIASDQLLASNPELVGLWIPSAYQVYYSFQSNIKKMLEDDKSVDQVVSTMAREIDGYLADFAASI